MTTFTFQIEQPAADPVVLLRACADDLDAVARGRRLLADWPDCEAIVVLQEGALIDRLKPVR